MTPCPEEEVRWRYLRHHSRNGGGQDNLGRNQSNRRGFEVHDRKILMNM